MTQLTHRITFFDLETGGLSPKRHPIIQIGAVTVNSDFSAFKQFERKIRFDEKRADPKALAINSYDRAVWEAEAIAPKQAAEEFAQFLNNSADVSMTSKRSGRPYKVAQLAAHNASFDKGFLFPWYKELGVYLPASWHVLDTIQLALTANTLFGETPASLKLTDLCAYYNIELVDEHDALADVVATAWLGRALLAKLAP